MDFTTYNNSNYLMTANHMAVGLNMPKALKSMGKGESEIAHGIPEYAPRCAFLVDEYPACPEHWMRSSGRTMSYFVPIKAEHGLWLDFNTSLHKVSQHVAVVVSAQGVNAITRLPCMDAALEQYVDNCPKHQKPFGPDRLCVDCGYKWPRQNYVTSAAQPPGQMWLDGFRSEDGVIRQYVFTKDQERSVAKAILGKDRVFALGVSFFLSKTQRPVPTRSGRLSFAGGDSAYYSGGVKSLIDPSNEVFLTSSADCALNALEDPTECDKSSGPEPASHFLGGFMKSASANNVTSKSWTKGVVPMGSNKISARLKQDDSKGSLMMSKSSAQYSCDTVPRAINSVQVQQVEIAAGAKVSQWIYPDPNPLDFYYGEPHAVIFINYCLEEDAEKIIQAGKVSLAGKETWPEGLKVGNP